MDKNFRLIISSSLEFGKSISWVVLGLIVADGMSILFFLGLDLILPKPLDKNTWMSLLHSLSVIIILSGTIYKRKIRCEVIFRTLMGPQFLKPSTFFTFLSFMTAYLVVQLIFIEIFELVKPGKWITKSGNVFYLHLLYFVVVGPLFEETLFRQYLFMEAKKLNWSTTTTTIVISFAFTFLHLQYYSNPLFAVLVLIFGILLTLTRIYTRSLIYPIVFHGLGNFLLHYTIL